ncbi:DAZ-associated protein [Echinococcus granulosus]|uniref:DAZ-associated protein n=1 Tax=Echinococcus granulosus TaxID=6210 RepID=W6U4U4_ECHGR|nr:DAZ-associated protein [Echinococcus granulosus]EUB56173.1 DAZ-associated protein [Echinococcus granulosus]
MAKAPASLGLSCAATRRHLICEKCGAGMDSTGGDLICGVCKKLCEDEDLEDDSVVRDASTRKQIFVGGIPARTNCKQLRDHFSRYGTVKNCFVSPHKPFGSVTFESEESARKAISKPIQFVCGKRVEVKEYAAKKKHGASKPQSTEDSTNESKTKSPSLPSHSPSTASNAVPTSPAEERQRYILMLHAKLDDLPRQLAALKLKSPTLKMEKKAKDEMIDALDKAVLQLYLAANTALDTTMAKVETMVEAGEEIIGPLVGRMRGLLVEVGKIEDVYARLDEITNLREAMVKQNSLENLSDEVARLGEMVTRLPPLPITQMHLSDLLTTARRVYWRWVPFSSIQVTVTTPLTTHDVDLFDSDFLDDASSRCKTGSDDDEESGFRPCNF